MTDPFTKMGGTLARLYWRALERQTEGAGDG